MSDEGARVFASADGMTWAEQATNLDFTGCTIADLAAGLGEVLLLTDADCAMTWVGRAKP